MAVGGHFISKDIVIGPLKYAEEKSKLKILIERFWGKGGVRGGLVALQLFWSLKKCTRTFHQNEPSLEGQSPLGRYNHP